MLSYRSLKALTEESSGKSHMTQHERRSRDDFSSQNETLVTELRTHAHLLTQPGACQSCLETFTLGSNILENPSPSNQGSNCVDGIFSKGCGASFLLTTSSTEEHPHNSSEMTYDPFDHWTLYDPGFFCGLVRIYNPSVIKFFIKIKQNTTKNLA